jgi:hypothetical protein
MAYDSCIKKKIKERKKSPRPQRQLVKENRTPHRQDILKETVEKNKKKPLNDYQKFVRNESKKDIYSDMSGKERLQEISKKWKHINSNK